MGIPSTMTNICSAGFVGSFVATLVWAFRINQWLFIFTDSIRFLVQTNHFVALLTGDIVGFITGCLFCYGSKVGWYHAIYLPVILIEMETGMSSVLGAVDECTLVLVCAGICFGQCIFLSSNDDATQISLCRKGLVINILCGDFIEVAYPFMEKSVTINLFAYLASGMSTMILMRGKSGHHVMSSAYLPLPISIFISNDRYRMLFASCVAFVVSFVGVCLNQMVTQLLGKRILSNKKKS